MPRNSRFGDVNQQTTFLTRRWTRPVGAVLCLLLFGVVSILVLAAIRRSSHSRTPVAESSSLTPSFKVPKPETSAVPPVAAQSEPSIKTDLRAYAESAPSRLPMSGGKFTDPTFGTQILRVTDETMGDTVGTVYSYYSSFNADNTLVFEDVDGTYGRLHRLDPLAFELKGRPMKMPLSPDGGLYAAGGSPVWDKTDPDKLYVPGGSHILLYQPSKNKYSLYADLTGLLGTDHIVQWQVEDKPNPRRFAFQRGLANNSFKGACVFEKDAAGPRGKLIYSFAEPPEGINEVSLDKTGRYFFVYYQTPQDTAVVDLDGAGQGLSRVNNADHALGHYDLGSGVGYGADDYSVSLIKRPLGDYSIKNWQKVLDFAAFPDYGAYHISARADDEGWILVSAYDGVAGRPFCNEIYQVATDGSGRVRRLLHHHSVNSTYYDTPRANTSHDGRLIAFSSTWGKRARRDLFLARVEPPPKTRPRTVNKPR